MEPYSLYYYYGLGILALILPRLPYVGVFFRNINTLVHEFAHALMALLTQAKVDKIELAADTSGLTQYRTGSGFSRFVVSIVGYPASMGAAWLCFWAFDRAYYEEAVFAIGVFVLINLILFVRNWYAWAWGLALVALCGLMFYYQWSTTERLFLNFVAFVFAVEGWYSAIQLFVLNFKKPEGDAKMLQELTHIPSWAWAFLFVAINSYLMFWIARSWWPSVL